MPYKAVVRDVVSRLESLINIVKGARDELEQTTTFTEATRCFEVLAALDDLYTRNGYIADKIGEAKTWMASLCERDNGNALPKLDIERNVVKALDALRSSHGFGVE
jgi:hypothetical protein